MSTRQKNALLVALYLLAGLILSGLIFVEFRRDRFGDCMSVGAFSEAECREYATE